MKTSRVAKLERLARSRPCPVCGEGPRSLAASARIYGLEDLDPGERVELLELLAAVATPACVRCGRAGHDLTRMTDDQLERMLHLLRALYGREWPADLWSPGAGGATPR